MISGWKKSVVIFIQSYLGTTGMIYQSVTLTLTLKIPSGYVKIAIENDPVEIVNFPIENGDFP